MGGRVLSVPRVYPNRVVSSRISFFKSGCLLVSERIQMCRAVPLPLSLCPHSGTRGFVCRDQGCDQDDDEFETLEPYQGGETRSHSDSHFTPSTCPLRFESLSQRIRGEVPKTDVKPLSTTPRDRRGEGPPTTRATDNDCVLGVDTVVFPM